MDVGLSTPSLPVLLFSGATAPEGEERMTPQGEDSTHKKAPKPRKPPSFIRENTPKKTPSTRSDKLKRVCTTRRQYG